MSDETRQQPLGLRNTGGVDRVEEFQFEPIKGYPMLRWNGKRPFTSTQYFPAQHKETYGSKSTGWNNRIYWGDNLQVMSHLLKTFRGQVKLVYIDPPFDSKADYKKVVSLRGQQLGNDYHAFEEMQYTDIWSNDQYLQFMYERLILIKELLAESGSLYFHCDPNRSHFLRCLLDEIFGAHNFVNEIVWQRLSAHNDAQKYGTIHDTIFFYKMSDKYTWNPQFGDVSEDYVEQFFDQVEEETGRRYARGCSDPKKLDTKMTALIVLRPRPAGQATVPQIRQG